MQRRIVTHNGYVLIMFCLVIFGQSTKNEYVYTIACLVILPYRIDSRIFLCQIYICGAWCTPAVAGDLRLCSRLNAASATSESNLSKWKKGREKNNSEKQNKDERNIESASNQRHRSAARCFGTNSARQQQQKQHTIHVRMNSVFFFLVDKIELITSFWLSVVSQKPNEPATSRKTKTDRIERRTAENTRYAS